MTTSDIPDALQTPTGSDAPTGFSSTGAGVGSATEATGPPPAYSSLTVAPAGTPEMIMAEPIMGSYGNPTRTSVRVGGMPKADWSGLRKRGPSTPNCARFPFGTKGNTQQYNGAMTAPADLKLTKKCKLRPMMDILVRHVQDWGLDTMLYTSNPDFLDEMLFVPREHTRLTFPGVLKANAKLKTKWDEYDLTNDTCLTQLLINSCDIEMREAIGPYVDDEEMSAAALLQLICSKVDLQTPLSWESRRAEAMQLLPKGFTGINIAQWSEKLYPKLQELERANQINATVMYWLFDTIVKLEVSGFSDEFRMKHGERFYQVVAANETKANVDLMTSLRAVHLCWDQILSDLSTKYQFMVQRGHWPAANVPKDSGAAPRMHLASSKLNATQQKIFQAFTAAVEKGERVTVCFSCGEVGHKENNPKCPNYEKNKGGKSGDKGKANDKDQDKSADKKKKFDHPAPAEGKPPFMIDDSTGWFLIYCKKCNKGEGAWQCTHFIHGADRKKNLDKTTLFKCKDEFKRTGTITHEQGKQLLQDYGMYCQPVEESVSPGIDLKL